MAHKNQYQNCCGCKHRVLKGASDYCGIDGHYMPYTEVFEGWCKNWLKSPIRDPKPLPEEGEKNG